MIGFDEYYEDFDSAFLQHWLNKYFRYQNLIIAIRGWDLMVKQQVTFPKSIDVQNKTRFYVQLRIQK